MLSGHQIILLKDDGCNTNVISRNFVQRNRKHLHIQNSDSKIIHSNRDFVEESIEVVINATIQIGYHKYSSNWAVASCRYDVLLGTPWHHDMNPITDYTNGTVTVGKEILHKRVSALDTVKINNLNSAPSNDAGSFQTHQLSLSLYPTISNPIMNVTNSLAPSTEHYKAISHQTLYNLKTFTGCSPTSDSRMTV